MDGRVLKQIKAEYTEHMNSDPEIRQLFALMQKGKTAKQSLGLQLAAKSGDSMTDTLLHVLIPELGPGQTISLSDALAIVPDALKTNHDFVSSYLYQLQEKLDQQAGIHAAVEHRDQCQTYCAYRESIADRNKPYVFFESHRTDDHSDDHQDQKNLHS